jgi:hypothetical protein
MTVARSWRTVAVVLGTIAAGCSTGPDADGASGGQAPICSVSGAYTVESLGRLSQDTLGVRIAALNHQDMSKSVFVFPPDEPLGRDACVDLIIRSLTERGLVFGRHGDLILIEREGPPIVPTTQVVPSEPSEAPDHGAHIAKVSDWSYTVDRSYIAAELTDLDAMMRHGRIIPHRDSNDAYDGYRIAGIQSGYLGHALGIRNRDIVHSIGGVPMDSIEGATGAYLTLRDANPITLEITRRGQRHTMSYEVK